MERSPTARDGFDPCFFERSPLFWPVADAARAVVGRRDDDVAAAAADRRAEFPAVESLNRVFQGAALPALPAVPAAPAADALMKEAGVAPVRFVLAAPRPARRAGKRPPIDTRALYDARITLEKVVPTRARSWHDLMNALVWGTFPRAKATLHARQHRAIVERIPPGARTLPPARTRELDALALLDEGGVLLPSGQLGSPVVFGHAIYESLALGVPPAVVAAIDLEVEPPEPRDGTIAAWLAAVDAALARVIDDGSRLRTPEDLRRIDLAAAAVAAAAAAAGS